MATLWLESRLVVPTRNKAGPFLFAPVILNECVLLFLRWTAFFACMHFNKILPLFVTPLGLSLLFIAAGLWLGGKRRGRWLVSSALGMLTLCSIPVISDQLLRLLEDRTPQLSMEQCPKADAVVILGGITGNKQRNPELLDWNDAVDRFEHGVALYLVGKAPVIIFTSGGDTPGTGAEGLHLKHAAIAHGVPSSAILQTVGSQNTEAEATNVSDLASRAGIHSILLVTSANHMPRAMLLFASTGLKVTAFPVDYQTKFGEKYRVEDFLPDAEALGRSQRAVRELIGLVYYTFRR